MRGHGPASAVTEYQGLAGVDDCQGRVPLVGHLAKSAVRVECVKNGFRKAGCNARRPG